MKKLTLYLTLEDWKLSPYDQVQGKDAYEDVCYHHYYSSHDLASSIWQENEIKGIQIRNEELKLPLLADAIMVYIEIPRNLKKKKEKKIFWINKCIQQDHW